MLRIQRLAVWCGALVLVALSNTVVHAQARNCNCPPDPAVQVSIAPGDHVLLGTFTRPDAGRDFIWMRADGTRDIPANLNVNDPAVDIFQAARVTVTGGAFCRFRIRLHNRSSNKIRRLRVAPAAGYTLSSDRSGAQGVFDAAGNFEFTLGVRARVRSIDPTGAFNETFDVTVQYQ